MIFILLSIMVPIVVFLLLPWALEVATRKKSPSRAILVIAGVLFFLSWYLPSPNIQGQSTAAVTHFLGSRERFS